jgi:5-hydroxyisourate hydrolase
MSLSTHVLDVGAGHPAAGILVRAERATPEGWASVASAITDVDGRAAPLVADGEWHAGAWRLVFDVRDYLGAEAMFPTVTIELNVLSAHKLHVPVLLNRFGYTVYRGS